MISDRIADLIINLAEAPMAAKDLSVDEAIDMLDSWSGTPEIVVTSRPDWMSEDNAASDAWARHRGDVRDAYLASVADLGMSPTFVHMDAEGRLDAEETALCRKAAEVRGRILPPLPPGQKRKLPIGTRLRKISEPIHLIEIVGRDRKGYLWTFPGISDEVMHSALSSDPFFECGYVWESETAAKP